MSPGQQAYERVRVQAGLEREWSALGADERAAWDQGAAMQPVRATLDLRQSGDSKIA